MNTTAPREITGLIGVDEVINLMRALGHYPTQQQVEDIRTEIRYKHLHQSSTIKDLVDLKEFIQRALWLLPCLSTRFACPAVYINHRPVFGLSKGSFEEAFSTLLGQQTAVARGAGAGAGSKGGSRASTAGNSRAASADPRKDRTGNTTLDLDSVAAELSMSKELLIENLRSLGTFRRNGLYL